MLQKATQQQTKRHNKRLVLRTVYGEDALSRANIARSTHLTPTTVSNIVSELIEEGFIEEVGRGPSKGGKPPILLNLIADARSIIGIDLGNRTFRGGIFDLRGNIQHCIEMPVPKNQNGNMLDLVHKHIQQLLAKANSPLIGLGIGTPGITNTNRGIVREAVNLGWRDFPLQELLEARYDIPIHIANDSQMAALGEFTFGGYQGRPNLVVVKTGQGISAGIVLNRHLYISEHSGQGEIGHVLVQENGNLCRCGNRGCLETIASTDAIVEKAKVLARQCPDSKLHQFAKQVEDIDLEMVFLAFEAGDKQLQQHVAKIGCAIGIAVTHLVAILDVDHIVLNGPLARFGDRLLSAIKQEMRRRFALITANETEIAFSRLEQNIVIQGAAALVLSYEMGM